MIDNAAKPNYAHVGDPRIVDHGVEAPELVDHACDALRASYGGQVAKNGVPGAWRCRQRVASALLISSMQDDVMALPDQKLGRHKSKAVRRSRDENARRHPSSSAAPSSGPASSQAQS